MHADFFHSLGLGEKEAAIYVHLLETGPGRASTIAYQVRLPRTTVQHILQRLEQEHMVARTREKNFFVYQAIDPKSLGQVIELKRGEDMAKCDRLHSALESLMPHMLSLMASHKPFPSVKFYRGREAVRTILFDTLSSKTELKDFANIDAMFRYVKDINDDYVAAREKSKVIKRSLLLDTPFARSIYESGKYSPTSHKGHKWINAALYPFVLEMNIYDGKVSYVTYVENDFTGVIIENAHIFELHESLWNLLWDLLPSPGENHKKK